MGSFARVYLDTNIFILAFEKKDASGSMLSNLFAVGKEYSHRLFVTSELTLSELLVLPYRTNDVTFIEAYASLLQSNEWLEVHPVERSVLVQAAFLRSRKPGLKLPDAIHLSTAIGTGCSHILTADAGINEQAVQANQLGVIRPDGPTLQSLIESLGR